MDRESIRQQLEPIFEEVFGEKVPVTDELTARDVANWDSLNHMVLITKTEESFGIKFSLRDLNKMKNVGALMDIIESKIG